MIDTPAHGESGGRALVLPHKAALLQDLAEQLGGIHGLVAHSFGAAAAALASRRAPLADRMGLIAPPGDVRHFTRMFGEALGFSPRVHDLVNDLYEQQYGVTFESLRADAVSMTQPMPTLLVHDTDDEAVPVEHVEWLHEAWSGTRLLRTSGLGHKGVLRDPAVVDEVVQFVAG